MRRILLINLLLLTCFWISAQDNLFTNGKAYYDTYHDVAGIEDSAEWNLYNVHDPSVYKDGDYYYMYSTDASWGGAASNGGMKRRSKDLVNWEYQGNAFDGVPESAQNWFKTHGNPDYTDNGVWAPFLFKLRDKYILYYSAPGGIDGTTFAYLGYATSESANGPWVDQGVITTAGFYNETTGVLTSDTINAIDPTVVFDSVTRKLWMAYGSWHTGLYVIELDTLTGGIKTVGDRGKRIANRKNTGYGQEAPELSYHNGFYYLFQSYDALGDLYNVRVGRASSPDGPYYDYFGDILTNKADNYPMVVAPYAFNDNYGWQGTGHCGVYNDNGQYYMFQQGRPTVVPAMMVGQVRKIFWVDNWPVVSPERYAGVSQASSTTVADIAGDWVNIDLTYKTSTNFQSTSDSFTFSEDGTFSGDISGSWNLLNDTLTMSITDGSTCKCVVYYGWDWEYDCKTLLYTGLSDDGICVWGKKVYADTIQSINTLVDGATYTIRSAYSHMLVQPADPVSSVVYIETANDDATDNQLWTVRNAGGGYYYMLPRSGDQELAIAVKNTSESNNARYYIDSANSADAQKFKLIYQDNGYYAVLSWASYAEKGFDLWGYSCDEGAQINQYTYSEDGWHQHWQFERVDSVAIDLSANLESNTTDREKEEEGADFASLYEPFDYDADYLEGENGGTGWGGAWTISGESTNIALVDGLTYEGLETSGKSLEITAVDGSGTEAIRTLTETYTAGEATYWISFLCHIDNPTSEDNSWQGISLNLDDSEQLYFGKLWGVSSMGVNDPDPYTNYESDYNYSSGLAWYVFCVNTSTGKAYMWINPDPSTKPQTSAAYITTDADINDGFNKIRIHLGQTAGITFNVDEFRLGTTYNGMLTDINEQVTIENIGAEVYPNPVTSQATIAYNIAEDANVSLEVYNQIGAKVAVVINNERNTSGQHAVTWNTSDLASGIYFYKIRVGDKIKTGKLIKE